MHVCLITPSFPPLVDGGVAIATGRLAEQMLQQGHSLTVVTGLPAGAAAAGAQRRASNRLVFYEGLVDDPLSDSRALKEIGDWATERHRRQPFDVILAYFIYPGGYVGTVLGERLGLPVVCSGRGNDISKAMFIDPQTLTEVLQHSTRLIFVSASLLHMADTLVSCRHKATVIANAVDCEVFCPALQSPPRRLVVLGTSGVLRWKKGVAVLLQLIRTLCANHEVRFLMAGYGLDADIDAQVAEYLRCHDLQHRVEITGPLPHPDMVDALRRMDIYVTTSYQEGMPNGVLEAMACALPVVATDADALPDLVTHGVTGYVCRMGDMPALTRWCRFLIEQKAWRRHLGQAGRQRVQDYFQPQHETAAIMRILQQARAGLP